MILADLNLSIRDINAISRAGCTTVEELRQKISDDMDGMKRQLGFATFDRIEDALARIQTEAATIDVVDNVVVSTTEYTRAMELHQMILAEKQIIENGLYRMGQHLKEMRDGKLYKQHGYQNFEDYCKNSIGFSRQQAYNYIGITENLPMDFVNSSLQIGVKKLSLLAKLDEPTRKEVIETVDVENTTVKKLMMQIEKLEQEKNKLESDNADIGQKLDAVTESRSRDLKRISQEKSEISENLRKKSAEFVKAQNQIMHLEKQIRELENRPVEVAVSEEEAKEVERLKTELENAKLQLMQADKRAESDKQKAVSTVRNEYEVRIAKINRQLAETQKNDNGPDKSALDKERFEALKTMFEHAVDEMEAFLDDVTDVAARKRYLSRVDVYYRDNLLYLADE